MQLLVSATLFLTAVLGNASAQEMRASQSVGEVKVLLASEKPEVRLAAFELIENSTAKQDEAIKSLVKDIAQTDGAATVRAKAVQWLTAEGGMSYEMHSFMLNVIKNDNANVVRVTAANAVEKSDAETLVALKGLITDLSDQADWSEYLSAWFRCIGVLVIIGIVILFALLVVRYIVFRDLRRSIMTASLGFAFIPQFGVSILMFFAEYWLFGQNRGPGIVTAVGSALSASVIVAAMYFIDRQDARRCETAGEWEKLEDAIEAYCGLQITPKMILSHLIQRVVTPVAFVEKKSFDRDTCERFDTAIRQTMWKMIDERMPEADAIQHVVETVKPISLKHYEVRYLLMRAEHSLRNFQGL
jgi:hypothetical protein